MSCRSEAPPERNHRRASGERDFRAGAPESGFDDILDLATRLCEVPLALVSLADGERQWVAARVGFEACETPVDLPVCAHPPVDLGRLLVIPDLRLDPSTWASPHVTGEPHLRFCAGATLRAQAGEALGTLCVLDTRPRVLDTTQREALRVLARQVMRQIELRGALRALAEAAGREEVLRREVDHRVKNSLQVVGSMLRLQAGRPSPEDALADAAARVDAIALLHDALQSSEQAGRVDLAVFLGRVGEMLGANLPEGVGLAVEVEARVVAGAIASACALLVSELVTNAARHAFPGGRPGTVRIEGRGEGEGYLLAVEDDGIGFTPAEGGQGLGLMIVEALASQAGGALRRPQPARGTRVELLLPS